MASGFDIGAIGKGLSSGIRSGVILGEGYNRGRQQKRRRRALDLYEKAGASPEETMVEEQRTQQVPGPWKDPSANTEIIKSQRVGYKFDEWVKKLHAAGRAAGPEGMAMMEKEIQTKRFELARNQVASAAFALQSGNPEIALDAINAAGDLGMPGSDLGFQIVQGQLVDKTGQVVDPKMLLNGYEMTKAPGGWEALKVAMDKDQSAASAYRARGKYLEGEMRPETPDRLYDANDYTTYIDGISEGGHLQERMQQILGADYKKSPWYSLKDDVDQNAWYMKWGAMADGMSGTGSIAPAAAADAALGVLAWADGMPGWEDRIEIHPIDEYTTGVMVDGAMYPLTGPMRGWLRKRLVDLFPEEGEPGKPSETTEIDSESGASPVVTGDGVEQLLNEQAAKKPNKLGEAVEGGLGWVADQARKYYGPDGPIQKLDRFGRSQVFGDE